MNRLIRSGRGAEGTSGGSSKKIAEVNMSRFATLVVLLAAFAGPGTAAAEDDARKLAFNRHCRNCHTFRKGDNRLGPSLYGIVNTKAGQVAGYRGYSGSLTGFTWDEATLDAFIANPASISPNTNMIFPPLADAAVRKKIIEFLKSTSAQ
jgi:cytochrome c